MDYLTTYTSLSPIRDRVVSGFVNYKKGCILLDFVNKRKRKTEGAIKNGQPRENRRGNQEWTTQRKPKGQSRMDNPEKTEGAIKNGQPRENRRDNEEWTTQRKPKGQ